MKMVALVVMIICAAATRPAMAQGGEEAQLIAVVQSAAAPGEKEDACRRLKLIGTAQAVPALATLLANEHLYQAACDGLAAMPFAEAGEALRAALKTTAPKAKAGVIHALGERRDRTALPELASLLTDSDPLLATYSANALGRMGGGEAVRALRKALAAATDPIRSAIVDALLQCAGQWLAAGERAEAVSIFELFDPSQEKESVRTAAYAGLIRAAGDQSLALALVIAGIEGGDPAHQIAALQLARGIRTPAATSSFTNRLTKVSPAVQMALLGVLEQRGAAAAAPAALAAARNPDLTVRLAAFAALGELGDVTAIPRLADAATSREEAEQKAARRALTELHRGPIGEAMVAQLVSANLTVQVELIRALTERKDRSAAPKLLELARTDTGSARRAALRGMEQFADGADLPALVQLLTLAQDEAARAEVRHVFEALADRTADGQKLDVTPIVQGLANGNTETRIALLQVSACFADAGLRAAFSAAIKGPDGPVSHAAARAMCNTRDVELMPALLELARNAGELNLHALALEGYVRLAGDHERLLVTPQQRVALLKQALPLATRAEEKRLILAGLTGAAHPDALALAEQLSADATVLTEADIAWLQIAKALVASEPGLAEASLNRLAAKASDNTVRTNAQALAKQFTSRWLCAGPYRQPGKAGRDLFDVAFAPEQPSLSAVTWRPVAGATDLSSAGIVDLAGEVAGDNCVIYLKTRVFIPAAQAVIFELGSDDGIKLWVNSEVTHTNNIDRGVAPGQDRAKAKLRQGWNDLLAKISQNGGGCGMSLRITAADGAEVPGLRYDSRGETQAAGANGTGK